MANCSCPIKSDAPRGLRPEQKWSSRIFPKTYLISSSRFSRSYDKQRRRRWSRVAPSAHARARVLAHRGDAAAAAAPTAAKGVPVHAQASGRANGPRLHMREPTAAAWQLALKPFLLPSPLTHTEQRRRLLRWQHTRLRPFAREGRGWCGGTSQRRRDPVRRSHALRWLAHGSVEWRLVGAPYRRRRTRTPGKAPAAAAAERTPLRTAAVPRRPWRREVASLGGNQSTPEDQRQPGSCGGQRASAREQAPVSPPPFLRVRICAKSGISALLGFRVLGFEVFGCSLQQIPSFSMLTGPLEILA